MKVNAVRNCDGRATDNARRRLSAVSDVELATCRRILVYVCGETEARSEVEMVDRLTHLRPGGAKKSQYHFDALTPLPNSFSNRYAPLSRTIALEADEDMTPAERYARAIQKRDAITSATLRSLN
jgi:hypothetical protein